MSKIANKRETAMDFLGALGGLDDQPSGPKQYLPVSSLMPDPNQPRKMFDQDAMSNLESGIRNDGILQPLLVRESGTMPPYIITDGERRWRIADKIQLPEVPVLIRNDIDAKRLRFVQAMANANRENLTDYELAIVIEEQLIADPKLKKKEIAAQLGKDASTVSRLLALLEPEYSELAKSGLIESAATLSHLKSLDEASQASLIEAAKNGEIITRDLVEEAKKTNYIGLAAAPSTVTDDLQPATNVATPHSLTTDSKISTASAVKLSLKIEDVEFLVPYFANKEDESLDIKMSRDIAIGLLENLGQIVPVEISDFANAIKESIKQKLHV